MSLSCLSISSLLEKYYDQEATDLEKKEVEAHLLSCTSCRDALRSMETLRTLLKAPVDEAAEKESYEAVWIRIEREIRNREKRTGWDTVKEWLEEIFILPKKVWVPAAAAAALVLFLFVLPPYVYREAPSSTEPTTVEYVESQTHNVMVYELEKTNATVIWLIENSEEEENQVS